MEHVQYVYTYGMDDEEVAAYLRDSGSGVLSLADGNEACAIPMSYAYEDGRVFVRLSDDGESRKMAFVEATEEACLVVYGEEGDESWSVLVRGASPGTCRGANARARRGRDKRGLSAAPRVRRGAEDLDLRLFELEVESLTGRRTSGTPPETRGA